jgi:tetratricopeptide (TPR) repeat protein
MALWRERRVIPGVEAVVPAEFSIQTELKVARSFLTDAEAKLHAKADVIFELARRVYRDPVPIKTTYAYGKLFGVPPPGEREKPPLDVGTKSEYREWLEEAALPIYRDLSAALERLRNISRRYPAAALIEDGEPKYPAAVMLAYGWLLLGDYYFYRCNWANAAKVYRAAFKLEPSSQELLHRLALNFINDGDLGRAQNFLERAIEQEASSQIAVEAHKQIERMASIREAGKAFRGSPAVLKTLIGVTIGAFVVCLSCICLGLWGSLGPWAEESGFPAAAMVVLIILGGGIFLAPAVATAIYYFVKRR